MPLSVLLTDFLVRQSIHSDPIAGDFVCHPPCGQLFVDTFGRKSLISSTNAECTAINWTILRLLFRLWAKIRGGVLVYSSQLLNCKRRTSFVWWRSPKSF